MRIFCYCVEKAHYLKSIRVHVFSALITTERIISCPFRKYYRQHRFIGVFEHREPKLMILDPALVVDIYVKHFKHFGDNTMRQAVRIITALKA